MARCPLLYVRGNHDDSFASRPPEGCVCIEDRLYNYQGVRILGLGGSHRYREGNNMYTEAQMARRIRRQRWKLWKSGGFDILLTHAPARHINDFETTSHQGFQCFTQLLDKYHPKYFIHGHIHLNYGLEVPRETAYGATTVLNAYSKCIFEY